MRLPIAALLFFGLGVTGMPDPEVEPALELTLELGGRRYSATEGEAFVVEVDGRRLEARVRLEPTRRFQAAGVSFRYPRELTFEYDSSDGVPMWTLDGTDCILLVTVLETSDADEALRAQLTETVGILDIEEPEFSPWSIETDGVERAGLQGRFYFETIDADMTLQGFAVQRGERTVTIVLQDFPDDGENDDEGPQILELLGTSFQLDEQR